VDRLIAQSVPVAVEVPGRARAAYVTFLVFIVSIYVALPQLIPQVAGLNTGKLLIGVAVAALAWSCLLEGRRLRLGLGAGGGMLYLFFAMAGISAIGSLSPEASSDELGEALKYLVGFLLAANVLDTRDRVRQAMAAIVIASLVPALGGILTYLQGIVIEERGIWIGPFRNSNFLAYHLVVSVPLALALREEVSTKQTWWAARRAFWLGALVVLCAGVLVTASRGGALGLLTVIGLWFVRNLLAGRIAIGVIGAAIVAVVAAPTNPLSRADTAETLSGKVDLSSKGRLDAWRTGMRMVWAHPGTGVGAGAFVGAYERYAPGDAESARSAHNSYVMIAAELGLPALAAFLITIGLAMLAMGRRQDRLARGLQTGLFGYLVCSLTGGFAFTWPLYFMLGAAAALGRKDPE
jgi:O-antigen ligase